MRCDNCLKRSKWFVIVFRFPDDKPHPDNNDRKIEEEWCLDCIRRTVY